MKSVKNNALTFSFRRGSRCLSTLTQTMDDAYVICKKQCKSDSSDVVTLRLKGSEGINLASEKRGDDIQTVPGQKVHKECRRLYCLPQNVERAKKEQGQEQGRPARRNSLLRSTEKSFTFTTDSLYLARKGRDRERRIL